MTKLRPTHSLLFALITAFLTMQWSVTHIHLADHHDHDGSHHQHQIESHAHHGAGHHSDGHHSGSHHSDTIDSAHPINDINVVELDHDCNSPNGKIKTPTHALMASYAWQSSWHQPNTFHRPTAFNAHAAHLEQSTIQLRAPPLRA